MAQGDFILSLTGIRGESNDRDYPEKIEVQGWSFAGSSMWDPNSGQSTGRVRMGEVVVTKRVDVSSPILLKFMVENRIIDDAKLINRKAGGNRQEGFFRIEMTGARVRSVVQKASSTGGTVLEETVAFGWTRIVFKHGEQGEHGALQGGPSEFEFDWPTNQT